MASAVIRSERRVVPLHGRAAAHGALTGSTAGVSLHSDMHEFGRRDSAKRRRAFLLSEAALFLLIGLIKGNATVARSFRRGAKLMTISRASSDMPEMVRRAMVSVRSKRGQERRISTAAAIPSAASTLSASSRTSRRRTSARKERPTFAPMLPCRTNSSYPKAIRRRPAEPLNKRTGHETSRDAARCFVEPARSVCLA